MATNPKRILEADILLACKPLDWFAAYPDFVPGLGQVILVKDSSKYKVGNNVTKLSALPFYGGDLTWSGLTGSPTDSASLVAYLTGNYEQLANKGIANGYTPLDAGGKVPAAHLPSSVMQYEGQWNASTNTPVLMNGTGSAGDVYEVVVAGSHDFGAGAITFKVGDWAVYNGTIWEKSINSNEVVSVNGLTGAVTLAGSHISITGYGGPSAGTVGAADTINQAIAKLDGNVINMNPVRTTIVSSATPTIVLSSGLATDQLIITAQAVGATFAIPTGVPVDGKMVIVTIVDNGIAQSLLYNAIFASSADVTLPSTTVAGITMYLGFRYNSASSKYVLIAKA